MKKVLEYISDQKNSLELEKILKKVGYEVSHQQNPQILIGQIKIVHFQIFCRRSSCKIVTLNLQSLPFSGDA